MAKARRVASEMLRVRLRPGEMERLEARAEAEDLTVSGLVRQSVGLPVLERGGKMPGAGRPRKTTASVQAPE